MSAPEVLVTGGGGFIGHHLVGQLLEDGARVRVLELPGSPHRRDDVEWLEGSICDADTVGRAMRGVQRVFHLAGIPHLWVREKGEFLRVNYEGTRMVLRAALREGVERFVFTSTESILIAGRSVDDTLTDADVEPRLEQMPGPYCRSKLLAEQAAFAAVREGLPVVVVCPTLPVGPGDEHLTPPTRMLLGFLNGTNPAYLDFGLNLVDVREVARGHRLAAERGRIGQRYIVGGQNIWMGDLLAELEAITGRPMPRRRLPHWLALVAGAVSELVSDHITRRSPLAPLTGVRLAATPMFFDQCKTVSELGLEPKPVHQTLSDAVSWMRARGLLEPVHRG